MKIDDKRVDETPLYRYTDLMTGWVVELAESDEVYIVGANERGEKVVLNVDSHLALASHVASKHKFRRLQCRLVIEREIKR